MLFCGHNPVFESGKDALKRKLSYLDEIYGRCREIWLRGVPVEKSVKELGLKEASFIRLVTCGNASLKNIISSAYRSFEKNDSIIV